MAARQPTLPDGAVASRDCHTLCFSKFRQVQSDPGGVINGGLSIELFSLVALSA
jgi:hypothetical protein